MDTEKGGWQTEEVGGWKTTWDGGVVEVMGWKVWGTKDREE